MRLAAAVCVAIGVGLVTAALDAQTGAQKLPPLKRQATPRAVVDEHLDALNECDWNRLMAQYPADVQVFLPGGVVINGREELGKVFATLVKPFTEGGLCGVQFERVHTFTVENTENVQWRATSEHLAEPYLGADAYVTRNGLMQAMVTTFQPEHMKRKQ
jgi:hypothetical protein